jgi:hypothetical protein
MESWICRAVANRYIIYPLHSPIPQCDRPLLRPARQPAAPLGAAPSLRSPTRWKNHHTLTNQVISYSTTDVDFWNMNNLLETNFVFNILIFVLPNEQNWRYQWEWVLIKIRAGKFRAIFSLIGEVFGVRCERNNATKNAAAAAVSSFQFDLFFLV